MIGKRVGAWFDRHWPFFATAAGGLLLAIPPLVADKGNQFELCVMIALVALGVVVGAAGPIGLNRMVQSAEDIQADRDLLYTTYLGPMLAKLRDVVEAPAAEIKEKYGVFTTSVCSDAAGMIVPKDSTDPARVNYYRLKGRSGSEYLEIVHKTRTVRRSRLDRKTAEGKLILERTLRGEPDYCPVVGEADSSQIDTSEQHVYACYASVSVTLDNTVYGMLSANSLSPKGIPESSVAILELFASVLAVAEAKLGVADAKQVAQ